MGQQEIVVQRPPDGKPLPHVKGPGRAFALVCPDVGAELRAMHVLELEAGSSTNAFRHPSDAVYYIHGGPCTLEANGKTSDSPLVLNDGALIHIGAGTVYAFQATRAAVRIVGGPAPVDYGLYRAPTEANLHVDDGDSSIALFHRDSPGAKVPFISDDARLIIYPGIGAYHANMNYVVMQPGEENVPHVHRESEDTIYILEGHATIRDYENDRILPLSPGDAVFIPVGLEHAVRADQGEKVVSIGGPCPADLQMMEAAGVNVSRYAKDVPAIDAVLPTI